MIQETLITTTSVTGQVHIAPMGIHVENDRLIILPFKPSTTLDNLLSTRCAVINYCDDVRIFAGCLTGRRDWPLHPAEHVEGYYLAASLSHSEVVLEAIEDDELRPRLYCKVMHQVNHKAFQGFNRAQFAVLEAAILLSRIDRLPWSKIQGELSYLRIGLEKTAGDKERQAWDWLMDAIHQHTNAQEAS